MLCVICGLCYVIKTLGEKEIVTMNKRMTIIGIDPKFGLSTLRSNSKILETIDFNTFQYQDFLSDCFE